MSRLECSRLVRVHYPVEPGELLVLRTDRSGGSPLAPHRVELGGRLAEFVVRSTRPFVYARAGLARGADVTWMRGPSRLIVLDLHEPADLHPFFRASPDGSFEPPRTLMSRELEREVLLRIYLPPGYAEAEAARFPVVYMQDGKNLFFPEEAFMGNEWHVDETLTELDRMSAIDPVIAVGIHAGDRRAEYTLPGYESYLRSVVHEIKPLVDATLRTRTAPVDTAVMGSSLGGVVSFFMAWEAPRVFGFAACMSPTFTFRDDLLERVLSEPKRDVRFYLDSGWPGDNYEVTLAMAAALLSRGYEHGRDLVHLAFPRATHDEIHWGERFHIPIQLWRSAARARDLEVVSQRAAQAPGARAGDD